MKTHLSKLLTGVALVIASALDQSAYAFGTPVFDFANLMESARQTLQQIQQYKTQVNQYNNMLENSKSLDKYTWDKANNTITDLVNSIDTLKQYKQQLGSTNEYLARYQTVDDYRKMACVNGSKCTQADRQALLDRQTQASEAQKRANDALFRSVDIQQASMQADARQLETLQGQAQGAAGQMAALQAANQLASAETNQLIQIRGLLVAQQNAAATRAAVIADREAIQAAGDEGFRSGRFKKSSGKTW